MSDKWSQSQSNFYKLCGSCCWWATVGWAGLLGHGGGGNKSHRPGHYLVKEDMMTKLNYSLIPPERADEVAELLLNSFFREEPLGIALGLPLSQVSRWLPAYVADTIKQNVSFMAVDPETDKIVGVSVNVIKSKDANNLSMMDYLDSSLEPIMCQIARFLGHLNKEVGTPNNAEKIMMILFLNVESHYGGRGIAQELTKKSEDYAVSIGVNSFQVDTTSEFSYKVYKKLGYETLQEEKFSDFEDEGVKVMENVDMGVHQHARVLYKYV
jgi:predicted N-acetyltransferase YhbS